MLRGFFGRAAKHDVITSNPAHAVERVDSNPEEREVFTTSEIGLLVGEADTERRGLILMGYYGGGIRLGDARSLTWVNIDAERGTLRYRPAKTERRGGEVEVPLHAELRCYLFETLTPPDAPDAPLFPALSKKALGGNGGLSVAFQKLMRRAGVKSSQGAEKTGEGRQFSKLSFHSLRHSAISHIANAGVSPELRQRLAGHTDAAVHRRYTHHELEPLAAAIGSLPGVGR